MSKTQEKLKIVCIGDKTVGKTSILLRLINDTFSGIYTASAGLELHKYHIENDKYSIDVTFFDTILPEMFKKADAFVLVADLTKPETFESIVDEWQPMTGPIMDFLKLANKSDLNAIGVDLDKYSEFHIVSAKTGGRNITELFNTFIMKLIRKRHFEEEILADDAKEKDGEEEIGSDGTIIRHQGGSGGSKYTTAEKDEKIRLLEEQQEIQDKLKQLALERRDLERRSKKLTDLLGIGTDVTETDPLTKKAIEDYRKQVGKEPTRTCCLIS